MEQVLAWRFKLNGLVCFMGDEGYTSDEQCSELQLAKSNGQA